MMIMEYCEHGSLQACLKSGMEEDVRRLVALDAARGLAYLASRSTVSQRDEPFSILDQCQHRYRSS